MDIVDMEKVEEQVNSSKGKNKGIVKMTIHKLYAATRAQIAAESKLSIHLVDTMVNELLQEGFIRENGIADSEDGKRAHLYSINGHLADIAAIIVEKTHIEYVITDLDGQVNDRRKMEINKAKSYLDNVTDLIKKLIQERNIMAAGVGVPGTVSPYGKVFAIKDIPEFEDCYMKKRLETACGILISVTNDLNIKALGYYRKGVAFTLEDMVYIHFGPGLGAGVIINGRILNGFTNFAGEIAYMQVGERRVVEECMKRKRVREPMLAKMIVNIICMINPSIIVLEGTYVNEPLLEKIELFCSRHMPPQMIPLVKIVDDDRKNYFDGLIEAAIETYCMENIN